VNIAFLPKIRYMAYIHCTVKKVEMATQTALEKDVVEKLLEALQRLPYAHTQAPDWEVPLNDRRIDAKVDFSVADRPFSLLIEVKKSVYPRDVHQILWQIRKYAEQSSAHSPNRTFVPLLAAESISSGAKELLRNELVGYYDTGGSLFIPARGAFIYVDKPAPQPLKKAVRTLFRGKRSQVFQALLHKPHAWFSVKDLAELAKASPATTSETLGALERFDWIEIKGQGPTKERRLTQPGALLDEWKKQILADRPLPLRRYYVPESTPENLAVRIGQACEAHSVEYAITQEAAAQRYAPFLSTISRLSSRMTPSHNADIVLGGLNARVVTEGANLTVIETRSQGEFLFKEYFGSVWLANPIQVYLDLLGSGGRSQEMAEHLRGERIGF
jgi:hypothetical protein